MIEKFTHKTMIVKSYVVGSNSFRGQDSEGKLGSSTYVELFNKDEYDVKKITINFSDEIIEAPVLNNDEISVYMKYNELPTVLNSLNGPGVLDVDFRIYDTGHINFKLYRDSCAVMPDDKL